LPRFFPPRVDLREGLPRESSSATVVPLSLRLLLRRAVDVPPAFLSVAPTPVSLVFTSTSRRCFSGRSRTAAQLAGLRATDQATVFVCSERSA
jgi:hypothetical protein